jgi:hypothetical protein
VQETLRSLKSKDALTLRSDVSRDHAELKQDLRRIQTVVAQMTSNRL